MSGMSAYRLRFAIVVSATLLSACGGGGGGNEAAASTAPTATTAGVVMAPAENAQSQASAQPPTSSPALGDERRAAAAQATSQSRSNACATIRPFYWEIGNRDGKLVSGSVAGRRTDRHYDSNTVMAIASASTWIFGAYVVQRQGGALSDSDRKFLQMRSGYVGLDNCGPSQTVDSCLASGTNGAYSAGADGRFDDGAGHLQKHASLAGLGAMDNVALAAEVQSQIGSDVALSYARPQPAGGLRMSPDAYALFLRKLLDGHLLLGTLLGDGAVCTDAQTCGAQQALHSPALASEGWHYALAHWVEDDAARGDGAFSSGGAFGFYPWIDATKTSYGIVARAEQGGGRASALCGRLIREAWATGAAQ